MSCQTILTPGAAGEQRLVSQFRSDLLAAIPMRHGTATAVNLATLARALYIQYGLPAMKVASCCTDGAANMKAASFMQYCLDNSALQMKRELGTYGHWCIAHRTHLAAMRGLLRLTTAPNVTKPKNSGAFTCLC